MVLARFVGMACLWACVLPVLGSFAAETPVFLLAIPGLVLTGAAFFVAADAIEMLKDLRTELQSIRLGTKP